MTTETAEAIDVAVREVVSPAPRATQLGPWILGRALGRGGQGSTYEARHAETGAVAAVKRFRVADMADWKRFELFEREAKTLAALDHPAIPRFLGSGASDDQTERWIAMALVDGEPLSRRLGQPSSVEVLGRLFDEALAVLAYLHARTPPVLHRDIKPQNLLVRADGRLAVVDFGSVRSALAPDGSSTVVGTFGYLAPEQLHGAASPASDLYALGVTMIALATGIDGASLPRKGLRVDTARMLGGFPDQRLARVWSALVEPDPDQRPKDVAAVRALMGPPVVEPPNEPAEPVAPTVEPAAAASQGWPWPNWRPRGPIARIIMFFVMLSLRLGIGALSFVLSAVLPRIHARQRAHVLRSHKRDPVRQQVALAQLAHRHESQRGTLAKAKGQVDHWRSRLRPPEPPVPQARRWGPRGRGS